MIDRFAYCLNLTVYVFLYAVTLRLFSLPPRWCGNLKPKKRASSGTNTAAAGRRKWNTGGRRRHELNLGCYGRARRTHARQKRAGWSRAISHSDDKPSHAAAGRKTAEVQLSADKPELKFHEEKYREYATVTAGRKGILRRRARDFIFTGGSPCCKVLCPGDIIAAKRTQMFLNDARDVLIWIEWAT